MSDEADDYRCFFLRFSWNILTELISPLSALMAHMIGCLRKENDVQAVAGLRLIPSFFFGSSLILIDRRKSSLILMLGNGENDAASNPCFPQLVRRIFCYGFSGEASTSSVLV